MRLAPEGPEAQAAYGASPAALMETRPGYGQWGPSLITGSVCRGMAQLLRQQKAEISVPGVRVRGKGRAERRREGKEKRGEESREERGGEGRRLRAHSWSTEEHGALRPGTREH